MLISSNSSLMDVISAAEAHFFVSGCYKLVKLKKTNKLFLLMNNDNNRRILHSC